MLSCDLTLLSPSFSIKLSLFSLPVYRRIFGCCHFPFLYGRHTAAVAIAVAATTPTKLVVAVFPPDVLSVVTVPLET